jgi:uncharacterized membrane protein
MKTNVQQAGYKPDFVAGLLKRKTLLNRILKNLLFAVLISATTYFINPGIDLRFVVLLGLALFVVELIATFFDVRYDYKQKIADLERRLFRGKKKVK